MDDMNAIPKEYKEVILPWVKSGVLKYVVGGKHPAVVRPDGHKLTMPGLPSDVRAFYNFSCEFKGFTKHLSLPIKERVKVVDTVEYFDPAEHAYALIQHPSLNAQPVIETSLQVAITAMLPPVANEGSTMHVYKHAKQSDELTDTRFIGDVCDKHPALKGLRYKCNGLCVGCGRDRSAVVNEQKKQERLAHRDEMNSSVRLSGNCLTESRYLGAICSKHPNMGGLRYKHQDQCIQCKRDFNNAINRKKRNGVKFVQSQKDMAAEIIAELTAPKVITPVVEVKPAMAFVTAPVAAVETPERFITFHENRNGRKMTVWNDGTVEIA